MQKTNIEYLDMTWNPLAMRCTPVSAGCGNCWHLRMANRLAVNPAMSAMARRGYAGLETWLARKELSAPLRRRKPARIGVQFMGDLFHPSVTNEQIASVYGAMAASPQHTFCVLTKRIERAAEWYTWIRRAHKYPDAHPESLECASWLLSLAEPSGDGPIHCKYGPNPDATWPIPNVWFGVSVEDQETLNRAWTILKIPAAKWFLSIEPMLNEIDLKKIGNYLDWVICGAETGQRKRHMELDLARSVRDQCQAAGVPFFFKQDSNGNRELDGRRWEEVP